jgi:hypothetical protein
MPKDYKFIEAPLRCAETLYLAVVTRLRREQFFVSRRQRRVNSSLDWRLEFAFDAGRDRFQFGVEVNVSLFDVTFALAGVVT